MRKKFDRKHFVSPADLLENKGVPKWDFHLHTSYTDGKATVRQVIEMGIQAGLQVIAITEHTEPWRTSVPDWFGSYVDEIEKYRLVFKHEISVFIGVEANAISFDGEVELTESMKEKSEFILGAAHRYPGMGSRKITELSNAQAVELEYRTLMGLAASSSIDAIAHIGATCSKYKTAFPSVLQREIIRTAAGNGIAIEINPVYHRPLIAFLEVCAEENASLTLGSNAHGFGDVGLVVRELQGALRND